MPLHFSCTMCGRCCHGLRLPLNLREAQTWIDEGGDVEVHCEAIPWPEEPPAENGLAWHRRNRSFAATSGHLPVRVIVTLVAQFDGACPNLRPDMGCGIYERRPTACRVYPAEANPYFPVDPSIKLCPPEAWKSDEVLQNDDGTWADRTVADAVVRLRESDQNEASAKARLCFLLGIHEAGLTNEGLAIHVPDRARLREALAQVIDSANDAIETTAWHLVSHRLRTMWLLESAGARAMQSIELNGTTHRFVALVNEA